MICFINLIENLNFNFLKDIIEISLNKYDFNHAICYILIKKITFNISNGIFEINLDFIN